MRQIVEWGVPAKISKRVYHRGCIKLPDLNNPVDIKLMLDSDLEKKVIGKAYLVENELGIFIREDIEWFIDIEYLDSITVQLFKEYVEWHNKVSLIKINVDDYDTDLTVACFGVDRKEYKEKDEVEFAFLLKNVFHSPDNKITLTSLLRDVKIGSFLDKDPI